MYSRFSPEPSPSVYKLFYLVQDETFWHKPRSVDPLVLPRQYEDTQIIQRHGLFRQV